MPKLYDTISTQSCLDGIHAAAIHGAHTHRTHYTKAMSFIAAHGHFAALTRDGLLTMSLEWADEMPMAMPDATDFKVEVPMVFEVDGDGMVSSREVREWLGY
ncbi:MAG: hypothetical protein EOR11_19875 [Mesorhizobium sp.]|uniref:hypothetical protein n=1 Tax=Mesorhizobium sp. TaxID=1871066 RepID=UPI000FEA27E4|nr:hypothetical protein [Mesorhizobium sp.]RWP84721.1 MAG: hypothetical protein EOR11_19875 [Mesorhizobium sp.]